MAQNQGFNKKSRLKEICRTPFQIVLIMLKIISLIISLVAVLVANTQTWNKDYGVFTPWWADIARSIEYQNDSIYVVYSDQNSNGGRRLIISNLSTENGLINRSKIFEENFISRNSGGDNSTDYNGEKYVIAEEYRVWREEDSEYDNYGETILLDQNFDTLRTRIIGNGIDVYSLLQARFTQDGGYVAVGWLDDSDSGSKILLAKYDNEGHEEWVTASEVFDNNWHVTRCVIPLSNGNYVTGGSVRQAITTPNRPILTLHDQNGNYLSHRVFGNIQYSEGWAKINPLSDGSILMAAIKKESEDENFYHLIKLDADLNIIWEKEHNANSPIASLRQLKENEDGTLIGVGIWVDPPTAYEYGVIMKFTSEGELLWERKYQHATEGFAVHNRFYDVVEIPEGGGYVACGERNDLETGQNAWVIKVDSLGCLVAGCDTITSVNELESIEQVQFLVGPNPTSDYLNVFVPDIHRQTESNFISLELRNSEGKLIETVQVGGYEATYILDVKSYDRGLYVISMMNGNKVLSHKKIILE